MRPIRSADGKVPKKNAPITRSQFNSTAASLSAELCQRTTITVRLANSTSSFSKHSLKTPSKNARQRSLDAAPKAAPRAVAARFSRCSAHPESPLRAAAFTRTTAVAPSHRGRAPAHQHRRLSHRLSHRLTRRVQARHQIHPRPRPRLRAARPKRSRRSPSQNRQRLHLTNAVQSGRADWRTARCTRPTPIP